MRIDEWMKESQVAFGTSGARGLVSHMTDAVCYAYTAGFMSYLRSIGQWRQETGTRGIGNQGTGRLGAVGIAGDLRSSSPRIMAACARAVQDLGGTVVNAGFIPSPALALHSISAQIPSMMVTGSHIPEDRNGIKFNLPTGEILKQDEAGIRSQDIEIPRSLFDDQGMFKHPAPLPSEFPVAFQQYVSRYLNFFPPDCLHGIRVALYEHSSVGRDAFFTVLSGLGATVTRLGRATHFVAVDTEAIRPEDVRLGREWARAGEFDALISADGDADRPLISDEKGEWIRGDIAGILCARFLGAQGIVTPVSSNTALEKTGWFNPVIRTRIGSPYVVKGMQTLEAQGIDSVVGYEANGGFLQATPLVREGRILSPLPTRDALIVALSILLLARAQSGTISQLLQGLPRRFTHSDRLKNFPTSESQRRLAAFQTGDFEVDARALAQLFGGALGAVTHINSIDGLRVEFEQDEIVHLRPSGNAPELRAYTEASTPERAAELNATCLRILAQWRDVDSDA